MGDHLSLESLRKALPDFEVLEELPATPFNNYVIVWGHRPVSGAKA